MRPSPPFRGGGPPNRGWYSGGPSPHRPFRHSPQGGSFRPQHSPYGPLPSFQSPPGDFRHSGGNFASPRQATPPGDFRHSGGNFASPRHATPPGDFRHSGGNFASPRHATPPGDFRHSGGNFASPRHATPPGDFRHSGGNFVSPRHATPPGDFRHGRNFASPRHSTPVSRGGARFDPPTTPFRTPPSRMSYGPPGSNNGSADTSAAFVTAHEGASGSFGPGRKSGPRRQQQDGSGGKRRRTETFPGSLLKPSMLEDPWARAVPVRRPEDGLVLCGGQRHSFLTPKKAAAAELEEEEEEEGPPPDLN